MTSPPAPLPSGPAPDSERVPGPGNPAGSGDDPAGPGTPGEPVLPEQSREDTDAAWGEYPESERDRLYRDRPPHWDDY